MVIDTAPLRPVPEGSAPAGEASATTGAVDPGAAERAVAVLVGGVVALAAAGPISDNSLLTHIATGRLQAGGGLPARNPFLWTSTDFPVPSWWWSEALGWVDRLAGTTGVRLLTAVTAAVLGAVVVFAARPVPGPPEPPGAPARPARTALGQILPTVVVLAMLGPFLSGRPHLPALVLLAVTLVLWHARRSPWWLVPIFAVWVNVHGSWLYGFAVLGLLWVAECLDTRSAVLDRWRWLAAAVGGLVLGAAVYPEPFRLLLLPTEQFGSPAARQAISLYQEWEPVSLTSPLAWVLAVVAVLGLWGAWTRRRVGSAVCILALCVLGLSAYRFLPVAAVTLAGFAAVGVEALSSRRLPGPRLRGAMVGIGAVALLAGGVRAALPPGEDLGIFPVREVDWLEQRGLVADPDVSLIHADFVGNYLEYRFGARAHAWVDDRSSPETMIDYVSLRRTQGHWRDALERADPEVVLWQRDDQFASVMAKRPDWVVGLTTDDFLVLCREDLADRCR